MFRFNLPGNPKIKKIILILLVIIALGIIFNFYKTNKETKNNNNKINVETQINSN